MYNIVKGVRKYFEKVLYKSTFLWYIIRACESARSGIRGSSDKRAQCPTSPTVCLVQPENIFMKGETS